MEEASARLLCQLVNEIEYWVVGRLGRIFGEQHARLPIRRNSRSASAIRRAKSMRVGSCPRNRARKTLDLFVSAGLRSQRHGEAMPARIQASGGFSGRRARTGPARRIAAISVALPWSSLTSRNLVPRTARLGVGGKFIEFGIDDLTRTPKPAEAFP